jgi:hypothetical protein
MLMSKHLYFQDSYDVWRYWSGICKSQRSINETRLGGWDWNRKGRINKVSSHPRPHSPICAYLDCQLVVMTMKWNFDVPKWKEKRSKWVLIQTDVKTAFDDISSRTMLMHTFYYFSWPSKEMFLMFLLSSITLNRSPSQIKHTYLRFSYTKNQRCKIYHDSEVIYKA